MLKKSNCFVLVALIGFVGASAAQAEDWSGTPVAPPVVGNAGPFTGNFINKFEMITICEPSNTPPPCTPGNTLTYTPKPGVMATQLPALPPGSGVPGSNLSVEFAGVVADPSVPSGLSAVAGALPLNSFARSETVDSLMGTVGGLSTTVNGLTTTVGGLSGTVGGLLTTVNGLSASVGSLNSTVGLLSGTVGTLSATVSSLSASIGTINTNLGALSTTVGGLNATVNSLGTSFTALSSTVNGLQGTVNSLNANVGTLSTQLSSLSIRFDQFQQEVHAEERTLREGVAMSLAMDGVGDLGPDEKVAISMNIGTYGGQNGVAAGVAFRVAQHLTFNGGIGTGFNRGLVGGRAGVRLAW